MKYYIPLLLVFCFSCNKYLDKPGDPTKKELVSLQDVLLLLDNSSIQFSPINTGSDEFFATPSMYNGFNPQIKKYYSKWIPNVDGTFMNASFWLQPYQAVFNANLSLETLAAISVTPNSQKDYNYAKGAAYFQRAYALTTIVWQFAKAYNETTAATDPGAVLDLNGDAFEKLKRSSVKETYEQIIRDAEESLKYLPERSDHPTRPSAMATYGLLARVYLSMRKYEDALTWSNRYLTIQKTLLDLNNAAQINIDASNPFVPARFGTEVIYYRNGVDVPGVVGRFGSYSADTLLIASYDENDLRKKAYFRLNGAYKIFQGGYGGTTIMGGICTDELFMIRAECYARTNEVQKAMDDLNELMVTRWKTGEFVPFTASTKEDALQLILIERKKQLCFRGLRWMDIKRLNEEGANISITRKGVNETFILPPKDPRFAMQLPQVLVDNFGYEQNPVE